MPDIIFNKGKFLEDSLKESSETKIQILKFCKNDILKAVDMIVRTFKSGGKLMLCGNGGSAADCQHIATEFVVRLSHKLQRPAMPAIALTTDSSSLTAGGNDIGFENIFARSVEGIGKKGDILLGISTSGNSVNIIKAFRKAKEMEIYTIGLLGCEGGKIKDETNLNIIVPSSNVQRIQEGHITIEHIICESVEMELYGK